MDDYTVVINAGSSSLKFCIYRRPEADSWRLEARGQIEGIGTSPRFSATNGSGVRLSDATLDKGVVRDARSALDALGDWLRSTLQAALASSASVTASSTAGRALPRRRSSPGRCSTSFVI